MTSFILAGVIAGLAMRLRMAGEEPSRWVVTAFFALTGFMVVYVVASSTELIGEGATGILVSVLGAAAVGGVAHVLMTRRARKRPSWHGQDP